MAVSRPWEKAAKAAGIGADARAAIDAELTKVIRGTFQENAPSIRQCQFLVTTWLVERSVEAGMDRLTAQKVCKVQKHRVEREQDYRLLATYNNDAPLPTFTTFPCKRGLYGEAHKVAVLLGIKDGVLE